MAALAKSASMTQQPVKYQFFLQAYRDCPQRDGENFHDWMTRLGERATELQATEQAERLPYREIE